MSDIINLKTGKAFDSDSSQGRLQAMLDAGVAPSICLETATKAYTNLTKKLRQNQALFSIGSGALQGSANASVGGMMRNVGGRMAVMSGGVKRCFDVQDYVGWGTNYIIFFDGIRNVGCSQEHDNTAPNWIDLVNNISLSNALYPSPMWNENSRVYSGGCEYMYITPEMASALNSRRFTTEFFAITLDTSGPDIYTIGNSPGSIREKFQTRYRYIQNSTGYNISYSWDGEFNVPLHICCVQYTETSGAIFVNGVKHLFTRTGNSPLWSTAEKLVIANEPFGIDIGSTNFGMIGNVYLFRMQNVALSDTDIAKNYAIDKARFNLPQ